MLTAAPAAALLGAALPGDAFRLLATLAVIPAATMLVVPPLRDLCRRMDARWCGESLAFVLDTAVLERVLAAIVAMHGAGLAALTAGLLAAESWTGKLAWGPVAPIGVGAALVGLTALAASVRPKVLAAANSMPLLIAAVGAGLIVGGGLDVRLAGPLAIVAILMPAQALPALGATLWLPWLRGAPVVAGAIAGAMVSVAGSRFVDPGAATLGGLGVNLLVATLMSLAEPGRGSGDRARLQATLPATWSSRYRPFAGAVATLWLFLVPGPGWSLLRAMSGGEGPAALLAVASGALAGLWLSDQKRTSQSMRP
jgi:hypothetical protein